MQYEFNRVAADAIVNIIKTTPVAFTSGNDVYFEPATLSSTTEQLEQCVVIEKNIFTRAYFLHVGGKGINFDNFGWLDRRRIMKAFTGVRKDAAQREAIEYTKAAKIRTNQSLNGILNRFAS